MSEDVELTVKISELDPANKFKNGDVVPIVQDGTTKKLEKTQLVDAVKSDFGSAASANIEDFAAASAVTKIAEDVQTKSDEQNQRIDRLEHSIYLIRKNGVFKAYRTKALMLADVANIPVDCVVSVVNDPANDPDLNNVNGEYHYDGNDFFKLPDNILLLIDNKTKAVATAAKTYTDTQFNSVNERVDALNIMTDYEDRTFQFAVADLAGNVGIGLKEDGRVTVHELETSNVVIHEFENEDYSFAFTDPAGNVGMGLKEDGLIAVAGIETSSAVISGVDDKAFAFALTDPTGNVGLGLTKDGHVILDSMETSSASVLNIEHDDYSFAFTDPLGNVAFAIKADGSIFPNFQENRLPSKLKKLALEVTDWMHGGTYGQSLARGSGAYPVVSTAQNFNNLTFLSGVLPRFSDDFHDFSGTKPLIEERRNTSTAEGETPVSGMLNRISEKNQDLVFFGTAGGQGGTRLELLSRGTPRYLDQLASYKAAYDLAQAQGKSYSVSFISFVQGESNYNANTSFVNYYALMTELKKAFDEDIAAITSQTFAPVFLTYQTASHLAAGREHINIARAQFKASLDVEDIVMVCPMYQFDYLSDKLHLTADDSQQLGKYFGNAAHQILLHCFDKSNPVFKPVQPENILWQGKIIDIAMNVPKGVLTVEKTWVTETQNYGFDIYVDDVLQTDAIQSVEIVGKNRVRIILNREFENASLCYGRGRLSEGQTTGRISGARGNLRDQAGDDDHYVDSKGVTRYMHNYCVIFQYSQTQGFN